MSYKNIWPYVGMMDGDSKTIIKKRMWMTCSKYDTVLHIAVGIK